MSLHARDLSCIVAGRPLWQDVRLTIRSGERWAVAGPPGSGKTLLLRMLAGLMPYDSGAIRLDDKPLDDRWPPAWRARVCYVPQRPALPEGTVEAALATPFALRVHRDKVFSRETACRYLDAIHLGAHFLEQDTAQLSGGEAQILNVLRALLIEPSILLLDEPTASLDTARTGAVETLIDDWLAGAPARGCVWTSHDRAQLERPLPVVGIGLVMVSLAGVAAVNRTRRRFPGVYLNSVLCVFAASYVVTGAAMLGIINVEPWYRAQYAIPLLGMVLGNILNGVSLALDRFMDGAVRDWELIEANLALGATRWEAAHPLVTTSLYTGMIPTINSMMVMGIVSLPGMMTGQLLAGAAPASAVRYQIVIMFMIAAATALGTFGVVLLAFRTLFSGEHRLRTDRLRLNQTGSTTMWQRVKALLPRV